MASSLPKIRDEAIRKSSQDELIMMKRLHGVYDTLHAVTETFPYC